MDKNKFIDKLLNGSESIKNKEYQKFLRKEFIKAFPEKEKYLK
jgi:hypothetical protein